ncbi:MAG: phosphoglucosamine mutase [Alphaproteobacteria bacterium]|jgi:phosphoglucosamine mutase|nr:phosphoglucosamine mutase [Alphaproteobacteria bacterium]
MNEVRQFFGTDGVRGQANVWPMTPDMIMKIAMATAQKFTRGDHRHSIVIGKDTRQSGYMVESALTAGFVSMGMDVVLLGPLPTPAVAMLTRTLRADLGVMISASHNPYMDNGIKFFGPDGFKLSDVEETEIEALIKKNDAYSGNRQQNMPLAHSTLLGKAHRLDDATGRYIEFAKATFPRGMRLDGLKIVVDCAHGAAYKVAPKVLWELGAEIIPIGITPDGTNINDNCGATSLTTLQDAVLTNQADLGIALDGDADRLIMVDETGAIIDGDQLLALIATSWSEDGDLRGEGIVATHMSNLGLERYLETKNLKLIRTAVGDRYVLEGMRAHGCNVGGEQSGHIILRDYMTTGDGIIAALQTLSVLVQKQLKTSQLGRIFDPVPQILKSIRTSSFAPLNDGHVRKAIEEAEHCLIKDRGRLLIRRSGTEPLIRIMAQGDNEQTLTQLVRHIVETIEVADNMAAA